MAGTIIGFVVSKLDVLDLNNSKGVIAASFAAAATWETARLLYSLYIDKFRIPNMHRKFDKGTPAPDGVEISLLDRTEEMDHMIRALRPSSAAIHSYFLVTGNVGTGKSNLMKKACHEVGPGVIYMAVPNDDPSRFGEVLAKNIGFRFDEAVSFLGSMKEYFLSVTEEKPEGSSMDDPVFRRVVPWLKKAAMRYHAKTGRPFTLVIDDLDLLLHDLPACVRVLQSVAKEGADSGFLRIVFMASHGPDMIHLLSDDALSSRMVMMEVGDITHDQAKELLSKKVQSICAGRGCPSPSAIAKQCSVTGACRLAARFTGRKPRELMYGKAVIPKLTDHDIERIVEVTGGRLSLLNSAAALLLHGHPADVVEERLLNDACRAIAFNNLLLTLCEDTEKLKMSFIFWSCMRELINEDVWEMKVEEWYALINSNATLVPTRNPMHSNTVGPGVEIRISIMTVHPATGMIGLTSPAVRAYVARKIGKPDSPERAAFTAMMSRVEERLVAEGALDPAMKISA